jgi:hypothetical protein
MTHVSLQDRATVKQHGYRIERYGDRGWMLLDPDRYNLMIGNYGQVAPTEWEAYAEALRRIAQDSREVVPASMIMESLDDIVRDLEGNAARPYVSWAVTTLKRIAAEHPEVLDLENAEGLI